MKCLAIDETPVLIDQSLRELQIEIDHKIPDIGKNAYLLSQSTVDGRSFVNSKNFRLRFLRFELFDVPKSAIRMLKWLDKVLDLFGSFALERPICISTDFSLREQQVFRKGYVQLLPVRATGTGRRIVCSFPYDEEYYTAATNQVLLKIATYIFWIIGNDIDAQRTGVAGLCLFDSSFPQLQTAGMFSPQDNWLMSVRLSAIHICTPDTPFFRLRRRFLTMAIGSHNRARLKLHLGTAVELMYKLQAYGIPIDSIPLTYTGKIKLTNMRQWLRLRHMIEDQEKRATTATIRNYNSTSSDSDSNSNSSITIITPNDNNILVEAPYLNDVLFKQGNSYTGHPGNNTLRSLIESKVKQHYENTTKKYKPNRMNQVERKALILHILDEFEHTYHGRFVNWHKSNTMSDYWWVILHNSNENRDDQKVIFGKVEPLFRKINTKIHQQYEQLSHKVFGQSIHKTNSTPNQKSSNIIQYKNSNNNSSLMIIDADPPRPITITTTTVTTTTATTINQNGGTFLFHSLDGNGKQNNNNNTQGGLLSLHHSDDNRAVPSSSLSSSFDTTSSECFGMKFLPCYGD